MTTPATTTLGRRALAEAVGTAFLVATVVGSGIAASRLAPDDPGLVLLVNSLATGGVLLAVILALQPVSAAFNPVVTLAELLTRRLPAAAAAVLVVAQVAGGAIGAVAANVMFERPAVEIASTERASGATLLAEVVATLGLVLVVLALTSTGRADRVALAVAAYVVAAYWFTSSTSFANPAVTVARTLSDSFAGIAPSSVLPFVAAQVVGALLAVGLARVLFTVPDRAGALP